MAESLPRYLREFQRYLPVKTLFLIHGNIYDSLSYEVRYGDETSWEYCTLRRLLHCFLSEHGYRLVAYYDLVDGMTFETEQERELFSLLNKGKEVAPGQSDQGDAQDSAQGEAPEQGRQGGPPARRKPQLQDPDAALDVARRVVTNTEIPTAVVIDFSSRLTAAPDRLPLAERREFIKLAKCAKEAASVNVGENLTVNNLVILICDKLNDLPPWLYFDNPLAKSLHVDLPDKEERGRYFHMFAGSFSLKDKEGAELDREESIEASVDLTHRMKNYELESLRILSRGEHPEDLKQIVQIYKYGESENPWDTLVKKIANAEEVLKKRVKGQDAAVSAAVDIVKRSAVGLSGTQHSGSSHKPRGILFFAGPTGTGKTELAKALAELLFGPGAEPIRFDMSEYAQEHSAEKLMGAPPGYVGYEEGGQLTERVKNQPFSVLLFDEIEKAHPLVLDKFLQVLEDGRMTSGRGETVYFSETVIIFTSNIGAYEDVPAGDGVIVRKPNILPYSWSCKKCGKLITSEESPARCDCGSTGLEKVPTPYTFVRERLLSAVEDHFKFKLGRPEIYNRIGNNFVVFDYIREDVIGQIVDKILGSVGDELKERRGIEVQFGPDVRAFLVERSAGNVEMGGRGIGNLIETTLINPLARRVFDEDLRDCSLVIGKIIERQENGFASYSLEMTQGG